MIVPLFSKASAKIAIDPLIWPSLVMLPVVLDTSAEIRPVAVLVMTPPSLTSVPPANSPELLTVTSSPMSNSAAERLLPSSTVIVALLAAAAR